jgi:hypothetical protein
MLRAGALNGALTARRRVRIFAGRLWSYSGKFGGAAAGAIFARPGDCSVASVDPFAGSAGEPTGRIDRGDSGGWRGA